MWCSKTAPTASRKVKYWPFSKRPSSHFIIIILITIDDEALLLVGGTEARPASPFPSQGLHLLQGGHFSGFGPNPGEQVHICFSKQPLRGPLICLANACFAGRGPVPGPFGFSKHFSCGFPWSPFPFSKSFSFSLPPFPFSFPFPRRLPFAKTFVGLVAGRHQDQPPTQPTWCPACPFWPSWTAAFPSAEELFFLLSALFFLFG